MFMRWERYNGIDLSYEHFHDRRTADRGVPANGDEPLRGYTRTFFGDPDKSFARANMDVATLAVEHRFSDTLTLHNRTQLGGPLIAPGCRGSQVFPRRQ